MKSLIILNGNSIDRYVLIATAREHDKIICADGGANIAYQCKLPVDTIIGDLDSISSEILTYYRHHATTLMTVPREKSETDGVLAVDHAIGLGSDQIDIVGAHGGRLDHQLGNIMLLRRTHDASIDGRLIFDDGYAMLINSPVDISCNIGDTISLIPYCGDVVISSASGLKYTIISDTALTYDFPLGISNVATSEHISIDIVSGYCLVFVYCSR